MKNRLTGFAFALAATLPLAVQAVPGNVDALIKSTPRLGAGAYYLGMPHDEAMAKLKAQGLFDGWGAKPSIGFHFRQLPGQDFLAGSLGTTAPHAGESPNPKGQEDVALVYTMYPSTPVVTAISRKVRYVVANAPNVANTLAALRSKYGHENDYDVNVLTWLFDESGHLLSAVEVKKVKQAYCLGGTFEGSTNAVKGYGPTDQERLARKITVGYARTWGGLQTGQYDSDAPVSDTCLHVIYLHAIFDSGVMKPSSTNEFSAQGEAALKGPADWARVGNDLVPSLTVYIYDAPLDYAASEASRAAVLAGGAQHEQQQQKAATKNKPNL